MPFDPITVRFTPDDFALIEELAPAVARRLGVPAVTRADLIRMALHRLAQDELPKRPKNSRKKA